RDPRQWGRSPARRASHRLRIPRVRPCDHARPRTRDRTRQPGRSAARPGSRPRLSGRLTMDMTTAPRLSRPALLEVDDLHVAYGKAEVLHGVCFSVHEGEFVSVLGRNGAGKSTTVHAVSGLLPKRAGRVRFAGADVS